jgi:hypothetical protein
LSDSRSDRFTPGNHWIGDWVGLRAGLDDVEKRKVLTLSGLELSRPSRSQSRYLWRKNKWEKNNCNFVDLNVYCISKKLVSVIKHIISVTYSLIESLMHGRSTGLNLKSYNSRSHFT